jgi:glycerol uptake facilitator-like aquaporin
MELIAESFGVFLYTFFGVGATAAFVFGGFLKEDGIGNILTIGLAYGLGIVFAIIAAAPTSGGHLSPGYTIAFAVFKGFSWKKVPLYIIAQIFGGFIAVLLVYAQYRQAFVQVDTALAAAGPAGNLIKFSPTGNAGILAIFPQTGQKLGYVFLNEFVCCFILAFLVATILDASNFFVSYTSAPWLIGLAYTVIIWGFSADTVVLNTARDLGGRFACGVIYGSDCFPTKYSALAALTNIPATILGVLTQTLLFMDSNRPVVNPAPEGSAEMMSIRRKATMEGGSSYAPSRRPTVQSTVPAKEAEAKTNGSDHTETK